MNHFPTWLRGALPLAVLFATAAPALAQIDPTNVPTPPTELAALERFFGSYEHADQFHAGAGPWAGTLEVGPAVKGWYVQLKIDTRFDAIDRQFVMLVTFDSNLDHYRVWGFDTMPQAPPGTVEGQGWFEGDEFIMEWRDQPGPMGEKGVFRNRVAMEGPDEIVITTEVDPEGGERVRLGVFRSTRTSVAEGAH